MRVVVSELNLPPVACTSRGRRGCGAHVAGRFNVGLLGDGNGKCFSCGLCGGSFARFFVQVVVGVGGICADLGGIGLLARGSSFCVFCVFCSDFGFSRIRASMRVFRLPQHAARVRRSCVRRMRPSASRLCAGPRRFTILCWASYLRSRKQ